MIEGEGDTNLGAEPPSYKFFNGDRLTRGRPLAPPGSIIKTIPALFIRERLMAFAFLARDNYDLPRQLNNTRVTNKFIDKERGSESFDTNPSSLALLLTVVPLACARGRFRNESLPYNSPYTPPIGPSRLLPRRIHNFSA